MMLALPDSLNKRQCELLVSLFSIQESVIYQKLNAFKCLPKSYKILERC